MSKFLKNEVKIPLESLETNELFKNCLLNERLPAHPYNEKYTLEEFTEYFQDYITIPPIPQESGVMAEGKIRPYWFDWHPWHMENENGDLIVYSEKYNENNKDIEIEWSYDYKELISMVYLIVKLESENVYYIRNAGHITRVPVNVAAAKNYLYNAHSRGPYPSYFSNDTDDNGNRKIYEMDDNKIDLIFKGTANRVILNSVAFSIYKKPVGTIPCCDYKTYYPMMPEFLLNHNHEVLLNVGASYSSLEPELNFKKAIPFFRILYRSLTGLDRMYEEYEDDSVEGEYYEGCELLRKIMENDFGDHEKDFKFCLHWLAALVQRPGIKLMTNIWFCGSYQGLGKSTLVHIMKQILGYERVIDANAKAILGGFNGEMGEKFILFINEKQNGVSPMRMSEWLKTFSAEPTLKVEKKGKDTIQVPNMLNVIGAANDPSDVFQLDDNDRRNVIFKTVEKSLDPTGTYWRDYAKSFAEPAVKDVSYAAAIAWILLRVRVDYELIETAYKTRYYNQIKAEQAENLNPLYHWALEYFPTLYGQTVKVKDLYDNYTIMHSTKNITIRRFSKLVETLAGVDGVPDFKVSILNGYKTCRFDHCPDDKRDMATQAVVAYEKKLKATLPMNQQIAFNIRGKKDNLNNLDEDDDAWDNI